MNSKSEYPVNNFNLVMNPVFQVLKYIFNFLSNAIDYVRLCD